MSTTISLKDYTEAYAVPGEEHLIDIINPITRLTSVYGHTFEQIRERYPNAQLVNVDEFCADKGARQDTPIEWSEVTEERYYEMLECLPPAAYAPSTFLVGEPYDHHAVSGQPRFGCFQERGGKYLEASRPMTRKEFWAFTGR